MPCSEFTKSSPPSRITNCCDILKPSPVPPYFLLIVALACLNSENIEVNSFFNIPIPVSFTENFRHTDS